MSARGTPSQQEAPHPLVFKEFDLTEEQHEKADAVLKRGKITTENLQQVLEELLKEDVPEDTEKGKEEGSKKEGSDKKSKADEEKDKQIKENEEYFENQIKIIKEELDDDDIEDEDYWEIVKKAFWDKSATAHLRDVFKVFDDDCDGYIEEKDLVRVMAAIGQDLCPDEVRGMLEQAYSNEDGKITFLEFKKQMTKDSCDVQ